MILRKCERPLLPISPPEIDIEFIGIGKAEGKWTFRPCTGTPLVKLVSYGFQDLRVFVLGKALAGCFTYL
jgi:hypothetical protein